METPFVINKASSYCHRTAFAIGFLLYTAYTFAPMKKKNNRPIEIDLINYGRYSEWDRDNESLPKFIELTDTVEAALGVEFGMIVEIRKARGRYLQFEIDHPPFKDQDGNIEPPFTGTFRVKHNPFHFFLGDTVWDPIEDKRGYWKLSILLDDKMLLSKTINII